MVMSWIYNVLQKDLQETVLYANSTREFWLELETRFTQGNGSQVYGLKRRIAMLRCPNHSRTGRRSRVTNHAKFQPSEEELRRSKEEEAAQEGDFSGGACRQPTNTTGSVDNVSKPCDTKRDCYHASDFDAGYTVEDFMTAPAYNTVAALDTQTVEDEHDASCYNKYFWSFLTTLSCELLVSGFVEVIPFGVCD